MKLEFSRLAPGMFLAVICIFASKYIYNGYKNNSGYCAASKVRISDKEKIDSAIRYLLSFLPKDQERLNIFLRERFNSGPRENLQNNFPQPYTSISDFKNRNEDCCRVLNQTEDVDMRKADLMDRLTGSISSFVAIRYAVFYTDGKGVTQRQERVVTYPITNCGVAWVDN